MKLIRLLMLLEFFVLNTNLIGQEIPSPPPPPPPPQTEVIDCWTSVREEMPRFPGCEGESDLKLKEHCSQRRLLKFIFENFKYPVISEKTPLSSMLVARFTVEKDGSLTEIEVVRGINEEVDKEAVRVIESMPKWIPGKQAGRPVRVHYNLPIRICLE